MSDTLTKPTPVTNDGGDHERFAHYVYRPKDDPRRAETIITEARINGTPVRALCGKEWVPLRDPEKFPICPDCQRILDEGRANGMDKW